MNWLDYVLLVPVVCFVIIGLTKGFAREFTSFLALYLALYLGFKGMYWLTALMAEKFDWQGPMMPFVGFMVIFVGVILLLLFTGKMFDRLFKAVALGWLNRLAGGLFGALKGLMLVSVLFWLVNQANLIDPVDKQASVFFPHIDLFSVHLFDWLGKLVPALGELFANMEKLFEGLSQPEL